MCPARGSAAGRRSTSTSSCPTSPIREEGGGPEFDLELTEEAADVDRNVRFRLPNGADQELLAPLVGANPAASLSALLARCIVAIDGNPPTTERIEALSSRARAEIEAAMADHAPGPLLRLEADCPECNRSFSLPFDIQDLFFGELHTSSDLLFREVHYLAYHYHWTESDILAMSPRAPPPVHRRALGGDREAQQCDGLSGPPTTSSPAPCARPLRRCNTARRWVSSSGCRRRTSRCERPCRSRRERSGISMWRSNRLLSTPPSPIRPFTTFVPDHPTQPPTPTSQAPTEDAAILDLRVRPANWQPDAATAGEDDLRGGAHPPSIVESDVSAVPPAEADAARPSSAASRAPDPEMPRRVWEVSLPHHARPAETTVEPVAPGGPAPRGGTPEVKFFAHPEHDTVQQQYGPAESTMAEEDSTPAHAEDGVSTMRPMRTPGVDETLEATTDLLPAEAAKSVHRPRRARPAVVDGSPTITNAVSDDRPGRATDPPRPTPANTPPMPPAIESTTSRSSAPPAMPPVRTGERSPRTKHGDITSTESMPAPASTPAPRAHHVATPPPAPTTVVAVAAPSSRRAGYRARLHLGRTGLRGPR